MCPCCVLFLTSFASFSVLRSRTHIPQTSLFMPLIVIAGMLCGLRKYWASRRLRTERQQLVACADTLDSDLGYQPVAIWPTTGEKKKGMHARFIACPICPNVMSQMEGVCVSDQILRCRGPIMWPWPRVL